RSEGKTNYRRTFTPPLIRFSDVIFYHFIHLGGAIITDIFTTSLKEALAEHQIVLASLNAQHGGIPLHEKDEDALISKIESESYSTWMIESAIGFSGFVVGKAITGEETEQGA
ncbi:MAG TPA: hypothetical protein VIS74_03595, partial [Chthoniobacterales bacterium]